MKKYWFLLLGSLAVLGGLVALTIAGKPRFDASIVCFNGKPDMGSSCSSTIKNGPASAPKTDWVGDMTCGYNPGKSGRIRWKFEVSVLGFDIYTVSRQFPIDDPTAKIATRRVGFRGERVVVFEDPSQAVVIDPPSAKK